MGEVICRIKSYIQPFERELAIRELQSLSGAMPGPCSNREEEVLLHSVDTELPLDYLVDRLTYWEELCENSLLCHLTRQVRRESTANLVRNEDNLEALQLRLPFEKDVPLPNRRVLRYGPHGIHEYRGKFFPQLVRSLLNIAGVDQNWTVLDTMCGSGTSTIEAILLGCCAVGMDFNPLSVLMSRAKCDILSIHPDALMDEYESLKADILAQAQCGNNEMSWFKHLHPRSQKYLVNWFSPGVLADLDPITTRVNKTKNVACRALFQLSLSNILREISWQKTDDLRIRKDVRMDLDIDVVAEFISELNRSVKLILAFLFENIDFQVGEARIIEGDARNAELILKDMVGSTDIIVTSPPYATALPYLDTDRISLCYLGLLCRPEHRQRDLGMIGNREITNGYRRKYLEEYEARKHELPADITSIIDKIDSLNHGTDAGFRRLNLPALLSRYFLDMRKVLQTFMILLKTGRPAYVVVGNNHTVAGGKRVEIETDKLLAELGESVGLKLEDTIPMEMLVSRDIFRNNTGAAETILFFKKC